MSRAADDPGQTPFLTRLHPAKSERGFDPTALPVRRITGEFWRHTGAGRQPLDMLERALAGARYHRKGQKPVLYASSTRDTAWGEFFRHSEDISPFEVRRRMAKLAVTDLPVLDLTDPQLRVRLGVTEQELTGNRYRVCQLIANLVRRRPDRFGGILAPSAADPNQTTLVIFAERRAKHVRVLDARIARPPLRLLGLFERVLGTLPSRWQDAAMKIARELRRELTQRTGI